ncbi:MAG TPA: hypothetical protein VF649_02040 [Sphingomonas sp.]|jgi:hypothetical protein|uniref:hypothetical protein n=1 Tax=Sphingomonas sp. TaxID=28214 RepID=UPI002EDAA7F6
MTYQSASSADPVSRLAPAEHDYLLKRADDHRRMAEKSEDPGSKAIHLRFEELYRERANAGLMVFSD